MVPVIITTQHRGVFFGYVEENADLEARALSIRHAKMAIRWNTTKGIGELALSGPNDGSIIGAEADIAALHDVTCVWYVTQEAAKKWDEA